MRPPGPKGLPLLGSTLDFPKDQLGFIEALKREHGDVARFSVAFTNWIQLTNPEHVYDVLVTRAALFHKPAINKRIFELFLGDGLLSIDGETWKRHHKLVLPGFHKKRVDAYGDIMVRYTEELLAEWSDGARVDFNDAMTDLTLAIVAKTLFDADVKRDARTVGRAMKVINEVLVEHVTLPIPVPRWWPTAKNQRKNAAIGDIDAIVARVIDERRRSGRDHGDLLSMLLMTEDEHGGRFNDKELRDESMTLFFAGHETTAHALTWMWYLLAKHPDVEARAVAEIQRELGGRAATVADLARLPYLEMVVKESMRVLPSVWVFMRTPTEDVEYGGYTLPKGSIVFISPYLLHRDARWFPQPLEFRPERFEKDAEKTIPSGAYLPFSMGPRVCLGKAFAMMEARLILATLLGRVRPVLAPGYEPVLNPRLSLNPKNGMPIDVRLRQKQ